MDSIFFLQEGDRAAFLQQIMQSFGCTYICLWAYLPRPSNCLLFMDGIYREAETNQLGRSLFDRYKGSFFIVNNGHVPGHAFKNGLPYFMLNELELQTLASNEAQLQFYQEARIKTAIFMGCQTGEIELGMFNNGNQVELESEMRNWFPEDFLRQPQTRDPNLPSSSSSSLRSLSMDSPAEGSPFMFNLPSSTSYVNIAEPSSRDEEEALRSSSPVLSNSPHQRQQQQQQQQAIQLQPFSQIPRVQFLTGRPETEDAAITKAYLAVISSPAASASASASVSASASASASSSSSHQISQRDTAFTSYTSKLGLSSSVPMAAGRPVRRRENMFKRAITFFTGLNSRRTQEQNRPTSSQLHHMISERRRRVKLNESFQALRSLLPPGSRKDKASVLASTTEYLRSLKTQVSELRQRNQILEAQLPSKKGTEEEGEYSSSSSSQERLSVRTTHIAESTSEARIVDLQVNVRGECSILDVVIRLLEFLKQVQNINLLSVEAGTRMVGATSAHGIMLRLKIEGGDWDESSFQEAVRRVLDDLAQ